MLKAIAKQCVMNIGGIVIAYAILAGAGYVAAIIHKRNCTNPDCPGVGICPDSYL